VVNADWRGEDVVYVTHDPDEPTGVRLRSVPAEHSTFVKPADLPDGYEDALRRHPAVRGIAPEGEYLRVRFADRNDVKDFCSAADTDGVETFEGVINPVMRWMVDNQIGISDPRKCYLDIETDSRVPFSRAIEGESRILSWAIEDDHGNQWSAVLAEDTDDAKYALIAAMWEVIDRFDLVAAWAGNRFDFPVVKARTEMHMLMRGREWRRWLWLDHLDLFERMNKMAAESGEEKQSMKLDVIAQAVLGEGKHDFDSSQTWAAWANATPCKDGKCMACRSCLLAYNVQDTGLMPRIEDKTGYIMLLRTLGDVCGTFADSRGINPQTQVESYLQALAVARDQKIPTRIVKRFGGEKYDGAFVLEPQREGILRDVHVADFAGLYPNIIRTWNMSPETQIDPPKVVNLDGTPLDEGIAYSPLTKVYFDTREEGILPAAVEEMMRLRAEWKAKKAAVPPGTDAWKEADRRSTTYKIAANSFYGVIGATTSRFFRRDVAQSVAQCGVWLIQETIALAEEQGMEVIYGDSVAADRPTIVRDPSGKTRILTMEELWSHARVTQHPAGKEQAELTGWKALARRDGADGFFPIQAIIRHATDKDLVNIATKHGHVEVTMDHSLMSDGQKITPSAFIHTDARFDVVSASPSGCAPVVDLLDELSGVVFSREYKGRPLARKFVPTPDGESIYLDGWGTPTRFVKRFYNQGSAELGALLRLVGAYVSEGSASLAGVTTSRYMFSIASQDRDWIESLKADANLVYSGASAIVSDKEGMHHLRSGTATMACLFAAMCGFKSNAKRLPSYVFDLHPADCGAMVEKMYQGDGSYDEKNGRAWAYTTISPKLASGFSYVLDQMAYSHSIHYRPEKGSYNIRTRRGPERPGRSKKTWSTREVEPGEYVYDLSVEGAHTFVDGVGRVLMHNTDSLFVVGATRAHFELFVQDCNTQLYPRILAEMGCARNDIKLAYEKQFRRLVFTVKKRYFGSYVHYDGTEATADSKPEIKGLEYKRGDAARMARQVQEEVVNRVLGYKCEPSENPADFEAILSTWKKRILIAELTLDDVQISKGLGKSLDQYVRKKKNDGTWARNPPHVEVARVLEKRGRDVGEGAKIAYYISDGSSKPATVKPAEDWAGDCDRHHLWEVVVAPPTLRCLEKAFPEYDWKPQAKTRAPKRKSKKPRGRRLI